MQQPTRSSQTALLLTWLMLTSPLPLPQWCITVVRCIARRMDTLLHPSRGSLSQLLCDSFLHPVAGPLTLCQRLSQCNFHADSLSPFLTMPSASHSLSASLTMPCCKVETRLNGWCAAVRCLKGETDTILENLRGKLIRVKQETTRVRWLLTVDY